MSTSDSSRHLGTEATTPLEPAQRGPLYLYLLPILLFPILLLLAAFLIIPTRWFEVRSGNTYLANLGYGAHLQNRSCDILIYGDSSAMVAISPAILTARTGLSACNIAEFEGMTVVNHTLPVDNFLAHNPRPRFIVFLYAPEDLYLPPTWISRVSSFEAISYRIEQQRNLGTATLLATHPAGTFAWAEQGVRMALTHIRTPPMAAEKLSLRASADGRLPIPDSVLPACPATVVTEPPDAAWIASLRTQYGVAGTRVLVDATPTAPCDPSLAYYQQHLAGLVDNAPYTPIPLSNFGTDGRLHVNTSGAEVISNQIAAQITAHISANGGR